MHMNSVRFLLNIGLEKALLLFFGFGLKTKKDKNNSLVDALKKWKKNSRHVYLWSDGWKGWERLP